jgi:protein-S-isoprenylcysteine O-methyltransferase Ste14
VWREVAGHWWVVALWVAWCALHSLLAADGVSTALRARLGGRRVSYRLLYNAGALLTLAPVYLATLQVSSAEAWAWRGAWRLPQAALVGAGLALFAAGARHYDLRQFLGLGDPGRGGIAPSGGLSTTGVLGVVRHPWYLAGLALVWARDLRRVDVLVSAVLSAYFFVGAVLEERRLLRSFGGAYREYRRRVPMLLPLRGLGGRGREGGGGGRG